MKKRILSILACVAVLTGVLMVRLLSIQILQGRELARAAVQQRARCYPLEMPRGRILDRNGVPLTDPKVKTAAIAFPPMMAKSESFAQEMAQILGMTPERVLGLLKSGDQPVRLAEINEDQARAIRDSAIDGVLVVGENLRYGPASLARHVVGYVGSGGAGMSGIEKAFDKELSGSQPTAVSVLVDAGGKALSGIGYRIQDGHRYDRRLDVVLTIDAKVQSVVETVLDKRRIRRGAVVVLDARTGEVLAMASRPDFDQSQVGSYLDNPDGPLFDRAVNAFAPGSVFKVVVAAAALEEGVVGQMDRFFCDGETHIGNLRFKCASADKGGHGPLNFLEALARSCNVAFIEVGQRIGAERLLQYARLFGFGEKSGIGLSEESGGTLPKVAEVTPGELANLSIGQGRFTATPLQVARAMTAIVNDGRLLRPWLVKEVRTEAGMAVRVYEVPEPRRVISGTTARAVRRALVMATTGGNAGGAFVPGWGSAGKTGSAETGKVGPDNRPVCHAWFVGYFPAMAPRYICCVVVEEGGTGNAVAAPIFREIMEGVAR